MPIQKAISEDEKALLDYVLKAGRYQLSSVALSTSGVMNYLKVDAAHLADALRNLSSHGFIRLTSLPIDLEQRFTQQVWNEIDMLDLDYLEGGIAESEYILSRRVLVDSLKIFPSHAEPLPPLEAAKLFREKDRRFMQILELTRSSQLSPSEESITELLSVREKLLPFKRSISSRITEAGSETAQHADLSEKRMRMLLLFSQVGLSQLATARQVAPDLLEELDVLRARSLVGEIPESEAKAKEEAIWNEISKRMTPQIPDEQAFRCWMNELDLELDALRSLHDTGSLSDEVFQVLSQDLNEDIVLLKSHISS